MEIIIHDVLKIAWKISASKDIGIFLLKGYCENVARQDPDREINPRDLDMKLFYCARREYTYVFYASIMCTMDRLYFCLTENQYIGRFDFDGIFFLAKWFTI